MPVSFNDHRSHDPASFRPDSPSIRIPLPVPIGAADFGGLTSGAGTAFGVENSGVGGGAILLGKAALIDHHPVKILFFLMGLAAMLFFSIATAQAAQVTLAWNASSGPVSGYNVYYGQSSGNYPTKKNAGNVTTYTTPDLANGTYYFVVKAYDSTGKESGPSNEVSKTITSTATAAPNASFTASPTSGSAPLLVTFTDTSTGSVASRSWNFGDGTSSTAKTIMKTYNKPGTFTAKLTVSNAVGSTTTSKTISATAAAPVANFSASPRSGTAPLTTTFTNTSTGTIDSYSWNFGDGSTSTAQNATHSYTKPGTYTVKLTATGPAGTNTKTQTGYITVATASTTNISGLVAAYSFGETSGATVVDASGKGNHGTISGAARTGSGKFGNALSFDGVNDWVTINDSASLDLTTGMTLAAWVYPTGAPSVWGTIAMKETPEDAAYGLFSDGTNDLPTAYMVDKPPVTGSTVLPVNTWTHLATTYNGSALVLYLNGNEVRRSTASGAITVSSGRLMLGGNSVWGDYFKGRIDEVRLYNRALSATEIKTDMNT
ncbi:MAG TPA: PKD domain-containing protein, partial [Xanthomonadaceae bacterium]|nr:PKD domain-containing protein [Xanthomonadaceae bacterium]